MALPVRTNLWQVPSSRLIYDGGWYVLADRTLGDHAWALLVPVLRRDGGTWQVAATPDKSLDLHRVGLEPSRLPAPPRGSGASHYICLLCYDYPANRPGSTFGMAFHATRLASTTPAPIQVRGAEENRVSVPELQSALDVLQTHFADDFARQLLSAEGVPGASPDEGPQQGGCRFAFASCQYPPGMMDRMQATASYRLMAKHFEGGLPTRLLLLGDQVYTDATYGLLEPTRLDDRYRAPYEELTSRHGPLGQLPQDFQRVVRMTPDDHEIMDDWEPRRERPADPSYDRGMRAYWRHQRGKDSATAKTSARDGSPVWQTEAWTPAAGQAGWQLFIADSRTARPVRDETNVREALILGQTQTRLLHQWLRAAPAESLKIVTSAAMLLPRTMFHKDEPLYLDNWAGYPASLESLLALLCEKQMKNVVFLSGDAHLACDATITVTEPATKRQCKFHSYHAPPLYAPYPFANEMPQNLILKETFFFTRTDARGTARRYECQVAATIPEKPRQGFGILHAGHDGHAWKLSLEVVSSA